MLSINLKTLYVRDQKTRKFIPLLAIRGVKGPPGSIDNITDYLTSDTGDSVELAMSQKGVTLLLSGIEMELENLKTELSKAKVELIKVTNSLEFLYGNGTLGLECHIDGDTCSVIGIGYAINNNEITIPSSIYNIPVTSIGDSAFKSCDNLTNIIIPNSVTIIGSQAFAYCEKLTSITIPDSVTTIGYAAFDSCHELTSITIPDSVTSIGSCAFHYCSNLTSITIPNSITSIGGYAFSHCDKLTDIYYQGTEAEWEGIEIDVTGNQCLANATVHFVSSLPEA